MSQVRYGDVTLQLVKTNLFEQTPIYSDDGIDYLYTRFVIDVSCIFNADAMPGYGSDPAQIMSTVRHALLSPRQILQFNVGTSSLLNVTIPDAKGGPTPLGCNITKIVGSNTFHVTWKCEAHMNTCSSRSYSNSGEFLPVLSNRWQTSMEFDENFSATRTTSGKLEVLVQGQGSAVNLDAMRSLCMPPLSFGWRRQSCRFGIDTTGRTLLYTIVDKEFNTAAPNPVTSINARYAEVTSQLMTVHHAEISVDVAGRKGTSKGDLLAIANQVALSRISEGQLESAEISEEMFENRLSLRMRVKKVPKNGEIIGAGWMVDQSNIGKAIPLTDEVLPIDLHERDGLLPSAIAWYNATCIASDQGINVGQELEMSGPVGSAQDIPEPVIESIKQSPTPSTLDPYSSAQTTANFYTDYELDISYKTNNYLIQLPVAADPDDGGGEFTLDPFSPDYDPAKVNGSGVELGDNGTAKSKIVQLAAPTQHMIVKWRGERRGAYPKIPSPQMQSGFATLDHEYVVEEPRLLAGGIYGYAIRGVMRVACETARRFWLSGQAEELTGPVLPHTNAEHAPVPSSTWVTNILFE